MSATVSIFRKPLCALGLCQSFKTNGDDTHLWGECFRCGKRVGVISRVAVRRYADAEIERELKARGFSQPHRRGE